MGTAIYCRISEDAEGSGLGVARQEKDCRKLAERLGWEVGGVYTDNDLSAFSGKQRPAYTRLLADLEARQVDSLIVWHPDRLHRSPKELEAFIDLVERTGAAVQTVTAGARDLATPSGRLHARIEGAVARHESEHKSERIRRKHLELAETGAVSGGGRRPFGYETDRRTVREDEAQLIREAARSVLAGCSLRSVVAQWNETGVQTVTGVRWATTTVKRLLRSGRIAGQREHHGVITAKAEWPGIISPAESARLRAILSDSASTGTVVARKHLLTGFIYCGRPECVQLDVHMTSQPIIRKGHRYHRYACTVDRGGCGRCGIIGNGLDDLITEAVFQRLKGRRLAKAVARQEAALSNDEALLRSIAEDEAALQELTTARYVDRTLTESMFQAARGPLERRLADYRVKVAALATTAGVELPAGEVLRERWDDLSLDEKRAIIGQVIAKIVVAPTERANNRFDPERLEIAWRV